MRSKRNVTLVLSLVSLFSVATACGDDGAGPGESGDAGSSGDSAGSGGSMTSGGSKGGGTAGKTSSDGGDPSGGGGKPSGEGGEPSGEAGHATAKGGQGAAGEPSAEGGKSSGDGGSPGSAGEPSGNAGEAGAGNGPVECTAITLGAFGQAQTTPLFALYAAPMTPNIFGVSGDSVRLSVIAPPYNGADTGTFDLTQNGDDNYKTCARCFTAVADGPGGQVVFYASEGTLEIESGSKQLGGTIDATVTNLKLVEVTIAGDLTSTPVPGGACLTLASATIQVQAPPCEEFECNNGYCLENANWTCDQDADCSDGSDEAPLNSECAPLDWVCPEDYFHDLDCDCGCGAKDPMCNSTTDAAECDYCTECQNNFQPCVDANVDPADTTMCQ